MRRKHAGNRFLWNADTGVYAFKVYNASMDRLMDARELKVYKVKHYIVHSNKKENKHILQECKCFGKSILSRRNRLEKRISKGVW